MFEASSRFSECANFPKNVIFWNLQKETLMSNQCACLEIPLRKDQTLYRWLRYCLKFARGTPASTRLKYKKHFSQCHQVQVKNLILVLKPKTLKYQHVWDPFFHLVLTDLDSGEKTFVVFVFVISIHRPEICVVGRTCSPGKAFIVFYCFFPRQRIE